MTTCALLTLSGQDRPGIVARTTRVLYEAGCNMADSTMTRLRGEFVIMLILRLPQGVTPEGLRRQLDPVARELELEIGVKAISKAEETPPPPRGEGCIVSVLGADQPGIVYRVTRVLEEEGGNIEDLHTQVIGSEKKPVYAMVIEAQLSGDLGHLQRRLASLATELGVDISARRSEVVEM